MFEILVRLIERAEQARRLNETAWILVFRPRCTPAVLNSHPRGLSDYSLVKEQGRLSDTFASRRSTSHSRANVGSNCRYRRRDAPHQPSFPCGEAESYRPACRCQRLSEQFFSRATSHGVESDDPRERQPVVMGVAELCNRQPTSQNTPQFRHRSRRQPGV